MKAKNVDPSRINPEMFDTSRVRYELPIHRVNQIVQEGIIPND